MILLLAWLLIWLSVLVPSVYSYQHLYQDAGGDVVTNAGTSDISIVPKSYVDSQIAAIQDTLANITAQLKLINDKVFPTFSSCQDAYDNGERVPRHFTLVIGGAATTVYCDFLDGKGWMLIMAYAHKANVAVSPVVLPIKTFPFFRNQLIGTDGSVDSGDWGHCSSETLKSFPWTSLRFYAKSSLHSRVIHFETSHAETVSVVKQTGSTSMAGLQSSFTALVGHSASLPASATNFKEVTNPDMVLNDFPFSYNSGSASGNRYWIVDTGVYYADDAGNTGISASTLHRVYVN